ncbi:nuclear transport factor 2 family protein [Leucobacter sp. UCMA 4100]|uniref:nuclear transport factor 2 family protein n=1 Tax=Leucobacter sp. UCMA 4100 TaxID=2810534 RepID=UPI0022EB8E27|nr:nuclear transport factor 2 family protein [Leucobacter sp. UCMA 4100]MDA3147309.1 nuclear transport factor 2 family protein [Leucobacter sp. UCMA 4100]
MTDQSVRQAVQQYVDGCRTANAAMVAESFDENAVMWGYLGPDYVTMTGAEFAENVVAGAEPAGPEFEAVIHSIVIQGNIAHAVLDEKQFIGADFRNFFGLVYREGAWRITSKVFQTV